MRHALAAPCGYLHDRSVGIDFRNVVDGLREGEIKIRQQVDLAEDHNAGGTKNMRIFERFVFTVGDREHHDLGAFAEVEQRRADQIADILDENEAPQSRL